MALGRAGLDLSLITPWTTRKGGLKLASGSLMLASKIQGDKPHVSLTPPSQVTFIFAVVLTVLSLLVRYTHVDIPIVSGHSYETSLAAFLLLLAGNLFRGF
jgi:hypothetical protein